MLMDRLFIVPDHCSQVLGSPRHEGASADLRQWERQLSAPDLEFSVVRYVELLAADSLTVRRTARCSECRPEGGTKACVRIIKGTCGPDRRRQHW